MYITFVIRNKENSNQYLDADLNWNDNKLHRWSYGSEVVFHDAHKYEGDVFMVLPAGREILVSEKDFEV